MSDTKNKIVRFKLKELPSNVFFKFINMYCYTMMCLWDTGFNYFLTEEDVFSEIENSDLKPYIILVDLTGNEI